MREQGKRNSARQNCRGFAISIDALLATVLVLGVLSVVGLGMQTTDVRIASTTLNIKQAADDAFAALDRSGTLAKYLADLELSQMTLSNPADPDNPGIYYEAERLLPETSGLKIVITEYLAEEDLTQCKQTKKFEECFGSSPFAVEKFPDTSLPDKEIIHGRRIAVMKETDMGKETPEGRECIPGQLVGWLKEKEEAVKWLLQEEPELETDIETWIGVTDRDGTELSETNPIVCYEDGSQANETAKVTIKARNRTRDPIAIMLAMDKSGSMETYDVTAQESIGTFDEGTCKSDTVWAPGMFNNALEFNGIHSYVDCGSDPSFNILNELTISVWVKIRDPNENMWRNIITKKNRYNEAEGYQLRYHPSANYLDLFGGGSDYARAENIDLDTGWHHIAAVISGTIGTLYVDGVDRTTNSTLNGLLISNDNFGMGKVTSYAGVFDGAMDELRLYDRALDAAEIATLAGGGDVSSNLFARWAFDESTGLIASDSSGNDRHCSLRNWAYSGGEAKWVPGQVNNALGFDGYDDYVEIASDSALDVQDFTFSAWFKSEPTNSWTSSPVIFMRSNNAGGNELFIGIYGSSDDRIYVILNEAGYTFDSDVDLLDQAWHHVAVTYDSSTLTVYIDGAQYGSPVSTSRTLDFGSSNAWIGTEVDSFNGSFGNYWRGLIDEVRLYDTVLDSGKVSQLYNGAAIAESPVAYWALDESSGDTAADSAGTNNGTLYNWVGPDIGGCQYTTGQSEQVSTNCPESKVWNIDEFTDQQHILSYDIGPIYPFINSGDSISFMASPTTYVGVCTHNENYFYPRMRLWVKKPDGTIKDGRYYEVDYDYISNPENGVYDINVWSDAPINYFVWLRQEITSMRFDDFPISGGTFEGEHNPPETECTNLGNWQKMADLDFTDYNTIYYTRFRFPHSSYTGQCGGPRFWIKYISQGSEWTEGKIGNALSFGGYNRKNYVEIPADTGLDVQNFTFSTWLKSGRSSYWTSYHPTLFLRGNDAGGDELFIGSYYRSGNELYVILDGSGYRFSGGTNLWDTEWHHVAVTYDGSTLTAYVDGAQYGSPVSTTKTLDFGNSDAWIGSKRGLSGHSGQYWYGLIDEVRLYDTVLDSGKVSQLYNGAAIAESPVAYWALDESGGYTASDSSGNGHHGTAYLDQNWFTGICTGNCDIYPLSTGIDGPFLAAGNYELWGWSDVPITVDQGLYAAYQYWDVIFGDRSRSDVLSGGTCSQETCYREAVPATTQYTNCPIVTGYEMPGLAGIDNWQVVNNFNVSSQLRGLNVEVVFDYTAGTDAVCPGAVMGFQHPIDGSDDPNWYYQFPSKGGTRTQRFGINDSSIHYRYEWGAPTPIPEGDYNILGWAEKDVAYSITWELQRIDAAKNAASTFIDNAAWKESDEIGLLAFSTATALEQGLTTQREDVKDSLALLQPSGETAMADAIEGAAAELENAEPGSGKFIVLLTDGKANVCRGGIACSESQAIADAIDAANDARDFHWTRIYVIGFADQSIIGSYEEDLREIAMDGDDIRFSEDCEEGALCGKYYYAADENALQEMYNLIALEIERIMGSVEVRIPVPQGIELSDYGGGTCGIWDETAGEFFPGECVGICSSGDESSCVGGETLTYYDQPISAGFWWLARFDEVLPCNAANCYEDYVLFPPVSTEVIETANRNAVSWDGEEDEIRECGQGESIKCHKRIPFKYADLNAAFTYGLLKTGDDAILLNMEIGNDGNKNIGIARSPITDGLQIAFYKKDHSNKLSVSWAGGSVWLGDEGNFPLLFSNTIVNDNLYIAPTDLGMPDNVCSWKEGNCLPPNYEQSYWKIRVEGLELSGCPNNDCEGTIIAEINQNGKVLECPLHNTGLLFCGRERLRFFTIDYYVWVK